MLDGRTRVSLSALLSLLPSLRLTFSGSHGHETTLQLGIVKAERDRRQKEGGEGREADPIDG